MQARVKKLARQAQGLDEKGKELFIHDFIVQNVRYDKLKKSIPTRLSGHWEMVLPSVRAWQKPLKSFVMSLESGVLLRCRRPITKRGIKYRHAWNVIKIGGQYYHLDATFDNTLSKDDTIRYDYVNLSDKQIARDHEPVIWKVPACPDGDHFIIRKRSCRGQQRMKSETGHVRQ